MQTFQPDPKDWKHWYWTATLNPEAHSWFKTLMRYGDNFPERSDESWHQIEARQKTCPHEHITLVFRVKEIDDTGVCYEYAQICEDCWFMKDGWSNQVTQ